jgi:hypothetical protein
MAFPGGPLPSPYPDRRIDFLPPEIDGRTSYRGLYLFCGWRGGYPFVFRDDFGSLRDRCSRRTPNTLMLSRARPAISIGLKLLRASALKDPPQSNPMWVAVPGTAGSQWARPSEAPGRSHTGGGERASRARHGKDPPTQARPGSGPKRQTPLPPSPYEVMWGREPIRLMRGVFGWFPVVVVVGLPTMPGLWRGCRPFDSVDPVLREQRRPTLASSGFHPRHRGSTSPSEMDV